MHERWETNEVNSNFHVVIPPLHSTHKFNITSDSQWGRLWLHFLSIFPEETEFSKWKYQTRILLYINTFLNTVLSFLSTWGQEGAAQPEERSCRKQAMRTCLCTSVLLLQGDTKRGSGAERWFPRPLIWLLGAAWSSGCRQRCSRRAWHSVRTTCSHRRLPCWSHRQACCVPGPWGVERRGHEWGADRWWCRERKERLGILGRALPPVLRVLGGQAWGRTGFHFDIIFVNKNRSSLSAAPLFLPISILAPKQNSFSTFCFLCLLFNSLSSSHRNGNKRLSYSVQICPKTLEEWLRPSSWGTHLSWALARHLCWGDIKVLAFLLLMKGPETENTYMYF